MSDQISAERLAELRRLIEDRLNESRMTARPGHERSLLDAARCARDAERMVTERPKKTPAIFYTLTEDQATPVVEPDAERWRLFMTHAPRVVGYDVLPDGGICSTTFAGVSKLTPPQLWETAIFREGQQIELHAWATLAQAEEGHTYLVRTYSGQRAIRLRE